MDHMEDNMEAKMEANKDDLEAILKENIQDLKKDMEGLKGALAKLLHEIIPNGEKVIEETHDDNKSNVNNDFL